MIVQECHPKNPITSPNVGQTSDTLVRPISASKREQRHNKYTGYMQRRDKQRSIVSDKAINDYFASSVDNTLGSNANTRDASNSNTVYSQWQILGHAQNLLHYYDIRGKRRNKNNSRGDTEAGAHRTRLCHLLRSHSAVAVQVRLNKNAANSKASLGGVATCGNVWGCPVCAKRIAVQRGLDIGKALTYGENNNMLPVMITLTARHKVNMSLKLFKRQFKCAWEMFRTSRVWAKKLKRILGIKWQIKAVEVLRSDENGWHYHYHLLVFADKTKLLALPDWQLQHWKDELSEQWLYCLSENRLSGLSEYATDVQTHGKVGEKYLSKLGLSEDNEANLQHEMSNQDSKKSKGANVWTLLKRGMNGDATADDLYLEYVSTMAGENWITWTQGMKAEMGIDEETDEEIAAKLEETEEFENLVSLTDEEFAPVRWNRALPELLRVARETRDKEAVYEFLSGLRELSERNKEADIDDLWSKYKRALSEFENHRYLYYKFNTLALDARQEITRNRYIANREAERDKVNDLFDIAKKYRKALIRRGEYVKKIKVW